MTREALSKAMAEAQATAHAYYDKYFIDREHTFAMSSTDFDKHNEAWIKLERELWKYEELAKWLYPGEVI